ncbi:MAG: hypothetical protein AAF572_27460 [Cyanobacteria bacterium P01_B01_bin.77]
MDTPDSGSVISSILEDVVGDDSLLSTASLLESSTTSGESLLPGLGPTPNGSAFVSGAAVGKTAPGLGPTVFSAGTPKALGAGATLGAVGLEEENAGFTVYRLL